MDHDGEKLLMAFMEGALDERGASRLLELLDSDPEFREMAVRHWRMDRLLEAGAAGAEESAEAIRRSVRIRMEGSAAESAELSRRVGSSLRARKGSGVYRRVAGRGRAATGWSSAAWALGGAAAAAFLIAVVVSVSGGNPPPPPRRAAVGPEPTEVAPPAAPKKERAPVVRKEAPAPVPPPGPSVPAPSKERRPTPPAPKSEGASKPVPPPAAPKKSAPPRRTVPSRPLRVAKLEETDGPVFLIPAAGRGPGSAGDEVLAGSGLEVGAEGSAVVLYPDGTRVEVGAESAVKEFSTGATGGKNVHLSRGSVRAAVEPQPRGKPMVLTTPQAEAQVLGTEFTLAVEAGATRLEVTEGRVRLTRRRDGASVVVRAGHFVVTHPTRRLAVRPIETPPADPLVLEVESLESARSVKPANGERGRLFLEPMNGASGGTCISAPGLGMTVTGTLTLPGGTSTVWVRWRDDLPDGKKNTISFEVLANGKVVQRIPGTGAGKTWRWTPVKFQGKGKIRFSLRSTYEAEVQTSATENTRQSPYGTIVRWDQIILTRDESFVPGNK